MRITALTLCNYNETYGFIIEYMRKSFKNSPQLLQANICILKTEFYQNNNNFRKFVKHQVSDCIFFVSKSDHI